MSVFACRYTAHIIKSQGMECESITQIYADILHLRKSRDRLVDCLDGEDGHAVVLNVVTKSSLSRVFCSMPTGQVENKVYNSNILVHKTWKYVSTKCKGY